MAEFKHSVNKTLVVTEMIIYGAFLIWFCIKLAPLGLK
jgi:hypothetical protein